MHTFRQLFWGIACFCIFLISEGTLTNIKNVKTWFSQICKKKSRENVTHKLQVLSYFWSFYKQYVKYYELLKLVYYNLIQLLYRHVNSSGYKKSGKKGLKLQFFGRISKVYLKINGFCQKKSSFRPSLPLFCSRSHLHVYTKVVLS